MKTVYFIFLCFLIANDGFSQKIISEHISDMPNFRHVLKKENGNYLVLGLRGLSKKLAIPVKTSDNIIYNEAIPDYYIFELNNENEIINKCNILKKNEKAHILLNAEDEDFSLIKSRTEEGKDKSTHRFFIERYNNSFGVNWTKEIIQSEIPAKVNGHKNGDFTLVFGGIIETPKICHFDSNGDKMWSKTIDDPLLVLNTVLMTSNGEFMVFGRKKVLDDDGNSIDDYLVMKLDKLGNTLWSKTYRGLGRSDAHRGIEVSTGDFIIGGFTFNKERVYHNRGIKLGGSDTQEISVFKISKNGDFIWHKSYGGLGEETFKDVLLTDDERIVMLAYTRSKDGDVYRNHGGNDVWIVQLDANGEFIWEETYGGNKNDYVRHISLDQDNSFTIFGSKQMGKKLVPWIFKIDDSFDISKPETHATERIDPEKEIIRNRAKIMDVESIKKEEDVDNFLADQIPRNSSFSNEIGLQAGDYLRNLESPQWFTEDFNQDGKLDLLAYGTTDEQRTYMLFLVESIAGGAYKGINIFSSFLQDKAFTPNVVTTDGEPMIILEGAKGDKNDSPFNYSKFENDTLVYKYGELIDYNEHPRDIKQIKCVELGFNYYAKRPVLFKAYPNRVIEVYSSKRWGEEKELIDTFEISASEQEMIYKVAAEFKPKEITWRTMWTHSSSISIKLEFETGKILTYTDNIPLKAKTPDKLYRLFSPYFKKISDSNK